MKKLILMLSLVPFLALGHAKEGGNGGGAHYCPENPDPNLVMELYDFFEGRHPKLHNIKVWEHDNSISKEVYLQRALRKVALDQKWIYSGLSSRVNKILAMPIEDLLLPLRIPPLLNDADIPFVNIGCDYVTVGNWNTRFGFLFFTDAYYNMMSTMSQAGLILHEAAYSLAREYGGADDSDRVRKFVAQAFSDQKVDTPIVSGVSGGEDIFSSVCTVKLEVENTESNLSYYLKVYAGSWNVELQSPVTTKIGKIPCKDLFKGEATMEWSMKFSQKPRFDGIKYKVSFPKIVGAGEVGAKYSRKRLEEIFDRVSGENQGIKKIKLQYFKEDSE
jgi:hypothetical protein